MKQLGYAAWVAATGPDDAFLAASKSKSRLRDFLDAVPTVDESARAQLYDKVEPLISDARNECHNVTSFHALLAQPS